MAAKSARLILISSSINSSGVKWVVHIKQRHDPVSTATITDVHIYLWTKIYRLILHNYGGWYGDVVQPTRTIVYGQIVLEMVVLQHIYLVRGIVHFQFLLQLNDSSRPVDNVRLILVRDYGCRFAVFIESSAWNVVFRIYGSRTLVLHLSICAGGRL